MSIAEGFARSRTALTMVEDRPDPSVFARKTYGWPEDPRELLATPICRAWLSPSRQYPELHPPQVCTVMTRIPRSRSAAAASSKRGGTRPGIEYGYAPPGPLWNGASVMWMTMGIVPLRKHG